MCPPILVAIGAAIGSIGTAVAAGGAAITLAGTTALAAGTIGGAIAGTILTVVGTAVSVIGGVVAAVGTGIAAVGTFAGSAISGTIGTTSAATTAATGATSTSFFTPAMAEGVLATAGQGVITPAMVASSAVPTVATTVTSSAKSMLSMKSISKALDIGSKALSAYSFFAPEEDAPDPWDNVKSDLDIDYSYRVDPDMFRNTYMKTEYEQGSFDTGSTYDEGDLAVRQAASAQAATAIQQKHGVGPGSLNLTAVGV